MKFTVVQVHVVSMDNKNINQRESPTFVIDNKNCKLVGKFEVAEEQLITAIDLFFENKSEVSVHTLVCAAHEIFDKLCGYKNIERGVVYEGVKGISEKSRKLVVKKMNEARNFFKHADNDSKETIKWNSELSVYYIWDATSLYRRLTNGKMPCEILIFSTWFRIQKHDLWENGSKLDMLIPEAKIELVSMGKVAFYDYFLDKCKNGDFDSMSN